MKAVHQTLPFRSLSTCNAKAAALLLRFTITSTKDAIPWTEPLFPYFLSLPKSSKASRGQETSDKYLYASCTLLLFLGMLHFNAVHHLQRAGERGHVSLWDLFVPLRMF